MLKKIREIFTNTGPKIIVNKKLKKINLVNLSDINIKSFGKKNKNKIFYIIRRNPSAGFFSNITFVLNHLQISELMNFIPIIDMKNFPTIYNEKNKIKNSNNSWNYYFKKLNKYSLEDVYRSKNVFLSKTTFENHMPLDMTNKSISKQFKKIKIRNEIKKKAKIFFDKKLKKRGNKILGIHLRGSTYKTARGHAFPPTPEIMIENIDKLIKKYGYNKLFLVTEEKNYLDTLYKRYGNKCIFYNSFRMHKKDSFQIYPRNSHRYKLGEEILIEALILSKCQGLTFIKSNVISAAILFAKKKLNLHEIFLSLNSRNRFISCWLWYLKKILPRSLGGLKILKTYDYK